MGPGKGTDAGEEVDAALLICLVGYGFGDIWKEQALLLDGALEEPPVVLDLLDIGLVEGEFSRLGYGGSCLSSSSSSLSSSSPGWGWIEDRFDDWWKGKAEGLPDDGALDII